MLGWFFVTTCVGGVLGLLAPQFQFTSPFEMGLPSSISSNFFVQNLIHPRSAQVQELISDQTPRPAAPFTYTNAWGFNLTLLGVWFVASMRQLRTVRAHVAAVGVLAVGVVVLVYSLNRAAWLGVGVAVLVVAVQLARRGRLAVGAALVVLMTLGLGAVAVTPLGTVVSQRLDAGKSDTIRGFTTEKPWSCRRVTRRRFREHPGHPGVRGVDRRRQESVVPAVRQRQHRHERLPVHAPQSPRSTSAR